MRLQLFTRLPAHEDDAILMGAHIRRVSMRGDLPVDEAFAAEVHRKPRMVIFSDPMNPDGAWFTPRELRTVFNALDGETLVVVDEACAEYSWGDDYPSAAEMLRGTELPWIVLRTSKAYGLAGLRIG